MSIEKPNYETHWQSWRNIEKLYKEKKELGKNASSKLKEDFSRIMHEYSDVVEESGVGKWTPLAGADPEKLKDLAYDLEEAQRGVLNEYKEKLEELNNRVQVLEDKIGEDKLEEDYNMNILRTEATFMADDLPFRPSEEWYNPTIKSIKEVLE